MLDIYWVASSMQTLRRLKRDGQRVNQGLTIAKEKGWRSRLGLALPLLNTAASLILNGYSPSIRKCCGWSHQNWENHFLSLGGSRQTRNSKLKLLMWQPYSLSHHQLEYFPNYMILLKIQPSHLTSGNHICRIKPYSLVVFAANYSL